MKTAGWVCSALLTLLLWPAEVRAQCHSAVEIVSRMDSLYMQVASQPLSGTSALEKLDRSASHLRRCFPAKVFGSDDARAEASTRMMANLRVLKILVEKMPQEPPRNGVPVSQAPDINLLHHNKSDTTFAREYPAGPLRERLLLVALQPGLDSILESISSNFNMMHATNRAASEVARHNLMHGLIQIAYLDFVSAVASLQTVLTLPLPPRLVSFGLWGEGIELGATAGFSVAGRAYYASLYGGAALDGLSIEAGIEVGPVVNRIAILGGLRLSGRDRFEPRISVLYLASERMGFGVSLATEVGFRLAFWPFK